MKIRDEGILVLSGGLTIHNLRDHSAFLEERAKPELHAFETAVLDAVQIENVRVLLSSYSSRVQTKIRFSRQKNVKGL
jgi:aromatic ring-opening dioxygenase catalytic subunit (LigB family)